MKEYHLVNKLIVNIPARFVESDCVEKELAANIRELSVAFHYVELVPEHFQFSICMTVSLTTFDCHTVYSLSNERCLSGGVIPVFTIFLDPFIF